MIGANRYMTLGTVEDVGHPWVSQVWLASEDHHTFHWVSSPDAKHPRALAHNPKVAIAIYDSSNPGRGSTGRVHERRCEGTHRPRARARASMSSTEHPKGTSVAVGNWKKYMDRRSSGYTGPRSQSTGCSSRAAIQSAARGSTAANQCHSPCGLLFSPRVTARDRQLPAVQSATRQCSASRLSR